MLVPCRLISFPAAFLAVSGAGIAYPVSADKHHRMDVSAACSKGSPVVSPSMLTKEWHPARTNAALACTFAIVVNELDALPSPSLWREAISAGMQTPTATSSSVVNVPVLSNRHASNFPAIGTRYGSVQKMCILISVIKLLFTASAVCIGNSGGITLVMMRMQCSNSSYWLRFSSCIPWYSTYDELRTANTKSSNKSNPVSRSCPFTFSCEPSIMRTSFPWADANPVRKTKQTQPSSGGLGILV
mmetsp:Transcript_7385/g.21628  ORF Transcript_7385/g.21628 Transcript_7385/m.21628 type:complete len:244 (-) Transcript_7385:1681-2412(-)